MAEHTKKDTQLVVMEENQIAMMLALRVVIAILGSITPTAKRRIKELLDGMVAVAEGMSSPGILHDIDLPVVEIAHFGSDFGTTCIGHSRTIHFHNIVAYVHPEGIAQRVKCCDVVCGRR